ncbi:MAG: FKBP-type peptidyl-prolyl cis-trans isomerase [Bdellovibrionaceae bacterium]|nr:FKBP-type peptidyl-prolyl cis-trans isomerase [Pseudobdellovibrionaceae bacterium]MDW8190518.1 FKBP-type peptidyl-prolyl cis-trans isomerase [Pseudobdellovibrionaceae bacterium]
MKKIVVLLIVVTVWSCERKVKLDTDAARAGYAIGQQIGNNLKNQQIEADPKAIAAAIEDVQKGNPSRMTPEEINQALIKMQENMSKKQQEEANKNLEEAKKFLEKNKADSSYQVFESGLQMKVEKEGTGPTPGPNDVVRVHYRGTLIDGKQFDSSYDRGAPAEFGVSNVIPGWTEALQKMKVGSKVKLVIPPNLAYGPQARPGIPANSVLLFDVELLEIVSKGGMAAKDGAAGREEKSNKRR